MKTLRGRDLSLLGRLLLVSGLHDRDRLPGGIVPQTQSDLAAPLIGDNVKQQQSPVVKANSIMPSNLPVQQGAISAEALNSNMDGGAKSSPAVGSIPPLNVVLLAVGTLGDVQPFVAVGLKLKEYGHRVRVATHGPLRGFVEQFGLEFYPLGGDPEVLAEFAVQSKGVFPRGLGQVMKVREQIKAYVAGQLAACTQPDPDYPDRPFQADALIANPISYGHIHVADALGIPLHILFTMPWTATREFAHPQARFLHEKRASLPPRAQRRAQPFFGAVNRATFKAIDGAMFVGTVDILNKLRRETLKQPSLFTIRHYHRPLHYYPVPTSYCWSPALLPQPVDWPANAEVVGFCQLGVSERTQYQPPAELVAFLKEGAPPVYVGFGSMSLKHPKELTRVVFEALRQAGVRAIVAEGWGGLGTSNGCPVPEGVLVLAGKYVPHDWLFPQCAAVIHHGGSGTTAAGLAAGCPTMAVPFFGDQAFWGEMCRRSGVGPAPVAVENLSVEVLVEALEHLMQPEVREAAQHMAARMAREPEGTQVAVDSFHRHLHGRLISVDSTHRQHAASDSATSISRMVRGHGGEEQPQGAGSPAGMLANGLSMGMQHAEAAGEGDAGPLHAGADSTAAVNGAPACRGGESKAHALQETHGFVGGLSGNGDMLEGVRYFRRKRAAWLTGWWESVAAFGAVLLLPLVSVVPCSTTALREDAEHARSGEP